MTFDLGTLSMMVVIMHYWPANYSDHITIWQ